MTFPTSPVPPLPVRSQGSAGETNKMTAPVMHSRAVEGDCPHQRADQPPGDECLHRRLWSCLEERDRTPQTGGKTTTIPSGECDHDKVTWKGSNGYVWTWTCENCGQTDTVTKDSGLAKPVAGKPPGMPQHAGDQLWWICTYYGGSVPRTWWQMR